MSLKVTRKTGSLPTDAVLDRLPDIFEWLPIGGETVDFQVSLSFDGHPSGSFSFIALAEDRLLIEKSLAIGSEFDAFGVGWRISSLAIAEAPASEQPVRPIAINVSLGGKYENYLSTPLKLNGVTSTPRVERECITEEPTRLRLEVKSTVQTLAQRAGTVFNGPGRWEFPIPADAPPSESTTLSNKISDLEFVNESFPFYSDPKAITAKPIKSVKTWKIEEGVLMGATSYTVNGKTPIFNKKLQSPSKKLGFKIIQSSLPGVPISPKAPPMQVEPPPILVSYFWPAFKLEAPEGKFVQSETLKEDEKPQGKTVTWTRVPPVYTTLQSGDKNASSPPLGSRKGDTNLNFDQSGPQKTLKTTRYCDGVEISSKLEVYGFVVMGENAVTWNGSRWLRNPNAGTWRKVKEYNTVQDFETKYGFHIGYRSNGWELTRYRQESSDIPETAIESSLGNRDLSVENITPLLGSVSPDEALEIPENSLRTFLGRISQLYAFNSCKVIEEQSKTLVPESLYFNEIEEDQDRATREVCLPNGEIEEQPTDDVDPGYAPAHIVMSTVAYKSNYQTRLNPEYFIQSQINTTLELSAEEKQDRFVDERLFAGSVSLQETSVVINSTKPGYESHVVYNTSYSSQGPSFRLKLQQSTFEGQLGRPATESNRLPSIFNRNETLSEELTNEKTTEEPDTIEYWVETPLDRPSDGLSGGSLSYVGCKTVAEAERAAKYDLWKRNVTGLGTKDITVQYNKDTSLIKEGDLVDLTVNNIKGLYRVMGLSYALTIRGLKLVTCSGIKLTLAPEPVVNVIMSRVVNKAKKSNRTRPIQGVLPGAIERPMGVF
ncbi:MAG: hypothetical protein ACRC8Y_09340 [Chroococcales cyanobacterium]